VRSMSAALKTPASPVASPITAVTTIAASVVAATRPPVIPAAPAALRPLEAGARVATDARRIAARKFLARCAGIARATRFAGKEDDVFLAARFALSRTGLVLSPLGAPFAFLAIEGCFSRFDDLLMFFLLFSLVLFLLGFFFAALPLLLLGFLGKLLLGKVVLGVTRVFVSFLAVLLVGPFAFFLKDRAAHVRIRLGSRLGLFMLGFDQPRRERGEFFLAEAGDSVVMRLGVSFLVMSFRWCSLLLGGFGGSRSLFRPRFTASDRLTFRFGVR